MFCFARVPVLFCSVLPCMNNININEWTYKQIIILMNCIFVLERYTCWCCENLSEQQQLHVRHQIRSRGFVKYNKTTCIFIIVLFCMLSTSINLTFARALMLYPSILYGGMHKLQKYILYYNLPMERNWVWIWSTSSMQRVVLGRHLRLHDIDIDIDIDIHEND